MPSALELLDAVRHTPRGSFAGGISNRGQASQQRLRRVDMLRATAEAHFVRRELSDDDYLQAQFRDRGLTALFNTARLRTPIDTGRLRSSMRMRVSRHIATISWNTPYAAPLEFGRSRSALYVERATRAGTGNANKRRPRSLSRRIRNFNWQGRNTIRGNRRTGRVSTRVSIPPPPRDMPARWRKQR